jgi:phage repressor protein C with HTH and peptisase S24 domain
MDPILSIIDEALKRKGLSDAAASKLAVGHSSLIKNLRMPREGEKRYNMPALQRLAEVLDLEFYFGPPRDAGHIEQVDIEGDTFAHIPLHDASLSAGGGVENSSEVVVDYLAFRQDWLKKIGVAPAHAVLARIEAGELGQSMIPTIHPGDLILIDTSKRSIPRRQSNYKSAKSPIYAFTTEGGARVKRISQLEDLVILTSDNPDFDPEFIPRERWDSFNVIGRVKWWAHTNRE